MALLCLSFSPALWQNRVMWTSTFSFDVLETCNRIMSNLCEIELNYDKNKCRRSKKMIWVDGRNKCAEYESTLTSSAAVWFVVKQWHFKMPFSSRWIFVLICPNRYQARRIDKQYNETTCEIPLLKYIEWFDESPNNDAWRYIWAIRFFPLGCLCTYQISVKSLSTKRHKFFGK